MNRDGGRRGSVGRGGSDPGLPRGLRVWGLWVLASAIGGAVGGASFVAEVLGIAFFFGVILGVAQAPVLLRYLRASPPSWAFSWVWAAGFLWIWASLLGWFVGWLVTILMGVTGNQVRLGLGLNGWMRSVVVPMFVLLTGDDSSLTHALANGSVPFYVVWTVLGVFQFAALWYLLGVATGAGGRRAALPRAALWVPASVVGGAVGTVLSTLLSNSPALKGEVGALLPGNLGAIIVGQGVGGAAYGAVTGVVLVLVVRWASGRLRQRGDDLPAEDT